MRRIILFFILFSLIGTLQAQVISTKNKKALKLFEQAEGLRKERNFKEAIVKYDNAIQLDSSYAEAYRQAAAAWYRLVKPENALPYYVVLIERYPKEPLYSIAHLRIAEADFALGHYQRALTHSVNYLAFNRRKDVYTNKAESIKKNCLFALERINQPLEFDPRELPFPINQFKQQYFPVLSADQSSLFFIKRDKSEEIFVAKRLADGGWANPVPIDSAITSEYNEGTCSVSADGRTLVFTSCMRKDGFGSCDLYITHKFGDSWTKPKNLGRPINSSAWDSQPALTADGRTLYYVSNRKGGIGKRDIWVTHLTSGKWSYPINLGNVINSKEDDISPFLHVNGQTMYFSTNSRTGFGGFDIYFTDLTAQGRWQEPINFGYPINTHEDELAMFITADGSSGYYSHESTKNGSTTSKLYEIDIPDEIRIKYRSSYIQGIIYDSLTSKSLAATVELFNLSTNLATNRVVSDSITGNYLMVLTEGAEYALYVEAKNYLFKSYHFNLSEDSLGMGGEVANIALSPIKIGGKTTLNNVLFEHDSFDLTEKSKKALMFVVTYLKRHSNLHIEIAGYTDNIGTAKYNLNLSNNRAASVYSYLIDNGVDVHRLSHVGYGNAHPIATNDNISGRAKNRRIELKILK